MLVAHVKNRDVLDCKSKEELFGGIVFGIKVDGKARVAFFGKLTGLFAYSVDSVENSRGDFRVALNGNIKLPNTVH